MRHFLFAITLCSTALVSAAPSTPNEGRLEAGPLTLDLYIARTANLFHAVDQIARWSEFCHTQYVPYFQGLPGGISQEDQDLLAQHCAIRRVHGWGGGLEQTLYTCDDLETALARGVKEGHLSQEEARDTPSTSQAHDYRKDPKHSIFIFGNDDRDSSDVLFKTAHRHLWGRDHVAADYQEMLTKNAKPGDTIILLLSLNERGRVPAEFSDLLPSPWAQVERLLQQGQAVFQQGKARDMDVFLLAAPTTETLRSEFRRLVREGKFVLDAGAKPK